MSEEISEGTGEVIPPACETLDPERLIAEAKEAAETPEREVAEAGPLVDVPLGHRDVAGAIIRHLMGNHRGVAGAMTSMVTARQLYIAAYRDLERRLSTMGEKQQKVIYQTALKDEELKDKEIPADITAEETWELIESFLVDAAAHAGSQEFDERMLKLSLTSAQSWFEEVIKEHMQWADADRKEAVEAWDKARRERPVPIGVKFDQHAEQLLGRERSLVFYGWKPAVLWLLDHIVNHVLTVREEQLFTVLRLLRYATHVNAHKQLIRCPSNMWEDCCKNSTFWERTYAAKIHKQVSDPVDLLIVDDLAWAGKSTSLIGGFEARKAGNAHKHFRSWAKVAGCAIIGGVLMDEKIPPALTGAEWEQLRLFTTLRPVWVEEDEKDEDKYLVHVGRDLATYTVDKGTLTSYEGSSLVLSPSDIKQGKIIV
jgi:hypothetical protein